MNLGQLQVFILDHLVRQVVPFWLRYSIDWQNGGMWTCLEIPSTCRAA